MRLGRGFGDAARDGHAGRRRRSPFRLRLRRGGVALAAVPLRATAPLVAAALLLGAALPAVAAACPRTSLADVEDEVLCPVCGTPLALATDAAQAKRQRAFIEERIDRCESKAQVKAALAAEFGPEVLGAPSDEGANLAAYLVPALAIGVAGGGIAVAALRWRRARGRPGEADDTGGLEEDAAVSGRTEGLEDTTAAGVEGVDDAATAGTADLEDAPGAARLEADLRRYDL